MKKFFAMMLLCILSAVTPAMAQSAGDKIVGTYQVLRNKVNSKVKITKNSNGTYKAQVIWADNVIKKDGSILYDEKNPDKSKRNVRADQIVLIDGLTYDANDKEWAGGKIYDPTKGKHYTVKCNFENDKKLKLRGYIGVPALGETMYWTKIQ